MVLHFISDGTKAGTDVRTPDGKPFGPVTSFRLDMDWQSQDVPTATIRLSRSAVVDILAESSLECVHDGRRYAMTDMGPAEEED